MQRYQGLAVTNIKLHFAWNTKDNKQILAGQIKHRLLEILRQDCYSKNIDVLEGKIGSDYVHMALLCPAKLAATQIAKQLKGRSSRMLQTEFPKLKEELGGNALWSDVYHCYSYGDMTAQEVQRLIKGDNSDF